jgi:hypothetical protein
MCQSKFQLLLILFNHPIGIFFSNSNKHLPVSCCFVQ